MPQNLFCLKTNVDFHSNTTRKGKNIIKKTQVIWKMLIERQVQEKDVEFQATTDRTIAQKVDKGCKTRCHSIFLFECEGTSARKSQTFQCFYACSGFRIIMFPPNTFILHLSKVCKFMHEYISTKNNECQTLFGNIFLMRNTFPLQWILEWKFHIYSETSSLKCSCCGIFFWRLRGKKILWSGQPSVKILSLSPLLLYYHVKCNYFNLAQSFHKAFFALATCSTFATKWNRTKRFSDWFFCLCPVIDSLCRWQKLSSASHRKKERDEMKCN